MTSTTVARPSRQPVVRMLVTSLWLVLVLVGLQTAWVGFAVAAVLVRRFWWQVVAVVGALTSIAMWPTENGPWFNTGHVDEVTLARAYLITWTVLCLVAAVLNTRVLSSRLGPGAARLSSEPDPALSAQPTTPPDVPSTLGSSATSTTVTAPVVADRIDVNTASVAQLRTLPGVTHRAARTAVGHRRILGRFRSLDEFAQIARIEGSDLLRLRERASCTPPSL